MGSTVKENKLDIKVFFFEIFFKELFLNLVVNNLKLVHFYLVFL